MVVTTRLAKLTLLGIMLLSAASASAQNELRATFFKDADTAKAAAEAANAELLAPKNFERGMKEFSDAESALQRGRNIETVRSNAAQATSFFKTATDKAALAKTALAQVMKSRQDAANAKAPELSPETWQKAVTFPQPSPSYSQSPILTTLKSSIMRRIFALVLILAIVPNLSAQEESDTTKVGVGKKNIVTVTEDHDGTEVIVQDEFVVVDDRDDTVKVNLLGGQLQINWQDKDSPVLMTGPAETVFEGSVQL